MIDDDAARQFGALGVKVVKPVVRPDAAVAVWPVNWRALELFLGVQTQWRVQLGFGAALWLGLDYAGVSALMAVQRLRKRRRLMADLQVMEAVALTILNGAAVDEVPA